MARKSPLTLVEPALTGSNPPRNLGATGTNLWREVNGAYNISDVGGIEMLLQLCSAADRVAMLAECIDADGAVVYTKTGPKTHPALKEELALRAFICRTLQRLGLNVETIKPPGRPGKFSSY
jgi:hypothetical protein